MKNGFFSRLFVNKTIIIRSENKVKYVSFTPIKQIFLIVVFCSAILLMLIGYRMYKFATEDKLILEYQRLENENQKYREYFSKVSKRLDKINEYIDVIDENNYFHLPENGINFEITKSVVDKQLGDTYTGLNTKNKEISKKIDKLGLNALDYKTQNKQVEQNNLEPKGGPFESSRVSKNLLRKPLLNIKTTNVNDKNYDKAIDKMIIAEKVLKSLPIGFQSNGYRITSRYGERIDPFENKIAFHKGLDIVNEDKMILASKEGKVVFAGKKVGFGNCVEIEHSLESNAFSIKTLYAHMDDIYVKKGDYVKQREVLGTQGNSGRSTGFHEHYEVLINNRSVDPYKFINYKF